MRARLRLLGATLVLSGALAGCGSDGPATSGSQSPPSVTQAGGGTTIPGDTAAETDGPLADAVVAASVHEPIQLIARPATTATCGSPSGPAGSGAWRSTTTAARSPPPATTLLDLSDQTTTEAERGLLGHGVLPRRRHCST